MIMYIWMVAGEGARTTTYTSHSFYFYFILQVGAGRGVSIVGRRISNLKYANDTTLVAADASKINVMVIDRA